MRSNVFVFCLLALVACVVGRRQLQDDSAKFESEVEEGVAVLRELAGVNLEGAKALRDAIASGDLEASKAAYIAARNEYEQIEVLAGSFEDIDTDIDARAYAFDNGEAVDGAEDIFERGAHFQGYHRIEVLLFRNGDVKAALPYAEDLVKDSEALVEALGEPERFSAAGSFAGMIGLSTEVAAKKMSSEEETYSDMSILIFYNNYLGVLSQYKPFEAAMKDADPELADEISKSFDAWEESLKPHVTQGEDGTNEYKKYTAVSVPERRDIQSAAYKVAEVLRKAADALGIDMGGEEDNEEECEGTPDKFFDGESSEIGGGLDYFRALMPFQIQLVNELVNAIESGDLAKAKEAYKRSRPPYEQIEVLAVSFEEEDSDIDARPYSFEVGEFDEGFKGFHKLEHQIYRDEDLGPDTLQAAKGLAASMDALNERLNDPELFDSVTNFEGMIGLATEVPAKKISSEEEVFSELSTLIYYTNWKGIYSQLKPFLGKVDAELAKEIEEAFGSAFECLGVKGEDTWNKVSAEDVTEEFVMALSDAEYPIYDLTDMELRECVTIQAYKIRDLVLQVSQALGVFVDCHPFHGSSVFTYRHSVF